MQKPKVSIIIVHYKNKRILFDCINSIKLHTKISFEIIVVDNGRKNLKSELSSVSSNIKYLRSPQNLGYAAGNNLGFTKAVGEILLILNPDTLVIDNSIETLHHYLISNKKVAAVGPQLLDKNLGLYKQIGIKELNPLRSLFVLTILSRMFPNTSFVKDYWGRENLNRPTEVDIIGGSVIAIKKSIFEKVGGFDTKYFLYFEEVDLCKRLRDLGYLIMILPQTKFVHYWKATTPNKPYIKRIFIQSRFYYFRKHYGLVNALIVETMARVSVKILVFSGCIVLLTIWLSIQLS